MSNYSNWLNRRDNFVQAQGLNKYNPVSLWYMGQGFGANPGADVSISPPQEVWDENRRWTSDWAGLVGDKFKASLTPQEWDDYNNAINSHNASISKQGSIIKPLALATIAASGLGAAGQAAGLSGLFGGGAEAGGLSGIDAAMADLASSGGLTPASMGAAGPAAAASAPGLTGIDAAMADLASSGGLTPASMGAAGPAAAGGSSLWDKLTGLLSGSGQTAGGIGGAITSLLPGLAGIYTNYTQNKDLGNLTDSVLGLYGNNSAYEKALRQQLERRDAAAGRRSQYGPREVELQAALAKLASNQTDSLANLYGAQNISRNNLLNSIGEVLGSNNKGPWSAVGGLVDQIPWGKLGQMFGG